MTKQFKIQPVILSGGSGTRLWPLSRESFPKQYLPLNSSSNFSFLQRTQKRLDGFKNIEDPIIICNEQHRFIVAEQMREININPKSIILEPFGKNTASSILIAALKVLEDKEDLLLLILSSDHEIDDSNEFRCTVERGIEVALNNNLVTFGIIPTYPATGYGYIKTSNLKKNSIDKILDIVKFIEKPPLDQAKQLLKDESILWNSGIFLFKASTLIQEFQKYQPDLIKFCQESLKYSKIDFDFQRLEANSFGKCPNMSIDVAVMEKTLKGKVLTLDGGWRDIGSWSSLWESEEKDKEGNVILGDVFFENVNNSYIRSEKRLLVAMGIENLIIVETSDAILITSKKETQNIKSIIEKLNKRNRNEIKSHKKIFRPWGYFLLIESEKNYQIKKIFVKPKASLSLQKHNYRSEHWIVLDGKAHVENGLNKFLLEKNQSTYIPLGVKHRLTNQEDFPLVIIEVQNGSYLGEDDIIRYDDDYGRNNNI